MDRPTAADLRARSALLRDRVPSTTAGDAQLEALAEDAAGGVIALTGRAVGVAVGTEGPFGCPLEEVPAGMQGVVKRLMARFAERLFLNEGDASVVEESIEQTRGGLASFSAGPYSESYFNPGQATSSKTLDGDPELHGLLWSLATGCVRAHWSRMWDPSLPIEYAPASSMTAIDWFPEGGTFPGGEIGGLLGGFDDLSDHPDWR